MKENKKGGMAQLERMQESAKALWGDQPKQFLSSGSIESNGGAPKANPDELDIDDDDDDDDNDGGGNTNNNNADGITQKEVPSSLFGSGLKRTADEEPMGAMERLKKRKQG